MKETWPYALNLFDLEYEILPHPIELPSLARHDYHMHQTSGGKYIDWRC